MILTPAPLAYRAALFADKGRALSNRLFIDYGAGGRCRIGIGSGAAFGRQSWATVSPAGNSAGRAGHSNDRRFEATARRMDHKNRYNLAEGFACWRGSARSRCHLAAAGFGSAAQRRTGTGRFYRGEIPRAIVNQVRAGGGILPEDDFERYQPEIVEPLATTYRGYRLLPSRRLFFRRLDSLQIVKVLEQFELSELRTMGLGIFPSFRRGGEAVFSRGRNCLFRRSRSNSHPD